MAIKAATYQDELAVRALYKRLIDAWNDSEAYAECFAPDVDYIIANGKLEHGWKEMVENHDLIYSAWARNSRLVGKVHRIRFLEPSIAIMVAYGHIEFTDHRPSKDNQRTVYTLVAQKQDNHWRFVHYQNTPLGSR